MSPRTTNRLFWGLLSLLVVLIVAAFVQGVAHAGMMGVGTMMSPTNGGGGSPGGGFAILTEGGSPLSTEAGSVLVTEDHP